MAKDTPKADKDFKKVLASLEKERQESGSALSDKELAFIVKLVKASA